MIKDKRSYRILVMEDNPGDMIIVEDFLAEQILAPVIVQAGNFKQAAAILNDTLFDVILLDLSLTDKSGQELITAMLKIVSDAPIIILTGYTDVDFSIKSIGQGVMDYLLKDDLTATALYKSIIYSIERKNNISEIKESHKQYSDLFHLSPQPMCLYEQGTFRITKINKAAIEKYGYSEKEFFKMTLLDLVPPDDKAAAIETITNQKRELNETYQSKSTVHKKSGEILEVETYSTPLVMNNIPSTLVMAIDVTEKNLYEHKIIKAIIKTQEDERYEIGGELHDNVCQLLAASQLSLGMLRDSLLEPKIELYNQCKSNITMALEEIRNLSHRLAPAFFDESTLEEAFIRLFNTFNIEEKLDIILRFDDSVKKYTIPLDIQLTLYRILQEQLRNIQKYARASLVEVDMIIFNNNLKMIVSDDGIGFDANKVKGGIGLANMKRRAELFSGKFDIIAAPGKGCSIVINIPLLQPSIDASVKEAKVFN